MHQVNTDRFNTIQKVTSAFTQEFVQILADRAFDEKERLRIDYGYDKGEFDLLIQKESYLSRILSFRFASADVMKSILNAVAPSIQNDESEDWFLAPLVYLRFCYPNGYLSQNHQESLLFTEPHYDKCHDLKALSIWVPFLSIDEETGGLCDFNGADLSEEFPRYGKNRFNVGKYLKEHETVDEMLKPLIRQPNLDQGDFLYFEHSVLHGATKPLKKLRLSINFQVVDWQCISGLEDKTKLNFEVFKSSMDACNALNLYFLNDQIGAKRYLEHIDKPESLTHPILVKKIEELFSKSWPHAVPAKGKMHWTEEFGWLN